MQLTEGWRASSPSRCSRWWSPTPPAIRASVLSARPCEESLPSFLGVPIIDRGLLQGVLVVQTIEPRTFAQHDVRMLVMAGTQLAPIVSEARTLGLVVAPTHQRLSRARAESLVEAGTTMRRICSGSSKNPALWR